MNKTTCILFFIKIIEILGYSRDQRDFIKIQKIKELICLMSIQLNC